MKIFLSILILIISFQSLTKADDIRDFEIEVSIGDSALKFIEKSSILKNAGLSVATNIKEFKMTI